MNRFLEWCYYFKIILYFGLEHLKVVPDVYVQNRSCSWDLDPNTSLIGAKFHQTAKEKSVAGKQVEDLCQDMSVLRATVETLTCGAVNLILVPITATIQQLEKEIFDMAGSTTRMRPKIQEIKSQLDFVMDKVGNMLANHLV